MGEVYKARDTRLGRTVAVKILPPHLSGDARLRQRFEREARAVSSLNHPHICTLHDVGSQGGTDYLVMEFLEGETLAVRLEKGPLPLAQVLKHGIRISDALDKAHRQGVVHRDLKPGNVMLTATGAKLLDFGLAKANTPIAPGSGLTVAPTMTSPVTQHGMVVGTFQYMSPEQVEGRDVDARSDLFALGAVLYEMLTGRRAFPGKSSLSVASGGTISRSNCRTTDWNERSPRLGICLCTHVRNVPRGSRPRRSSTHCAEFGASTCWTCI